MVATVLLVGCYPDQEPPRQFVPGDPLYEQFTTTGDRTMATDDDGEPAFKIRQRSHNTRVFDANMAVVGQAAIDDDDEIKLTSIDGQTVRTTRWIDDDTAVLDDAWRMVRASASQWTLYDSDDHEIARLVGDNDERWTLSMETHRDKSFGVEQSNGATEVVDDEGQVILRLGGEDFDDRKALALAVDALEVLDRYGLALWAQKNL